MAVIGEPLHSRHGVALWSAQTVKGTGVTPATAMGLVDFDVTQQSGVEPLYGLGSPNALILKPGVVQTDFNITVRNLQTSALLLKGQRAAAPADVLDYLTLAFGFDDDTPVTSLKYAWQVRDCKIHSMDVSLDAGGPLNATINGVGGLISEPTTLTAANLAGMTHHSHEAILTKGGAAYESVSLRFTIGHGVEVSHVIRGAAAADYQRGWTYQTEGNLDIRGEITRFARSATLLAANTLTDFALVLTSTTLSGAVVISATFADVQFGSETLAGRVGELFKFTTPFVAKSLTLA